MALPRPALLGILGALLIAATFMVTHRGSSSNGSTNPTTAPVHATATKPAPAKHAAAPKHTAVKKSAPVKVNPPAGQEAGASVGLPLKVARAFAKKQVVVLYFR